MTYFVERERYRYWILDTIVVGTDSGGFDVTSFPFCGANHGECGGMVREKTAVRCQVFLFT